MVAQDLWIHSQQTNNIQMKHWEELYLKTRIVYGKFVRNQISLFLLLLSSIELCALVMKVQEKQIIGKPDPSLLKQKGVCARPLCSKIKNGESITAPDDIHITPNEVMGWP